MSDTDWLLLLVVWIVGSAVGHFVYGIVIALIRQVRADRSRQRARLSWAQIMAVREEDEGS